LKKTRLLFLLLSAHLGLAAVGRGFPSVAQLLARRHWISYAPTHYYPGELPPVYPGIESITADLNTLRTAGFDGLITYGSELEGIPGLAKKTGFRSMLIGIWDPWSPKERAELLKAVVDYPDLIAGVIVGNEGLASGRYTITSLCEAMNDLRRMTSKPVSSTEAVDWVIGERSLAACSTFLSVNAHPYFSNHQEPQDASQWTVAAWDAIHRRYPRLPLLFKEVGLPSRGVPGLSEESQKSITRC